MCNYFRQKRDAKDMNILYEFFKEKNPFNNNDHALRNISNGMEAKVAVNADNAEAIGREIMSTMYNQRVKDFTFKRNSKAITMADKNALVLDGEVTLIDPQLLFQRLILLARNYDDQKLADVFKFELCQRPSSLFDDYGFMRHTNKTTLGDDIIKIMGDKNLLITSTDETSFNCIIDGEWLISTILWKKNESFSTICSKYAASFKRFTKPLIVFQQFSSEPTIMDQHLLRQNKGVRGLDVVFTGDMVLTTKKESFLTNKCNKKRFIDMLTNTLVKDGCNVICESGNADAIMAKAAVSSADTQKTAVISDNIELLLLLCHFYNNSCNNELMFIYNSTKKTIWNIHTIRNELGDSMSRHLLFLYAINGSKITSHLFGIGQGVPLKKYKKNQQLAAFAEVFYNKKATNEEIISAGTKALVILYNGTESESLDLVRFQRFKEKVSVGKSAVLVQNLPPSSAAAKYHLLRVYLQIQMWTNNEQIEPESYGWVKNNSTFSPITTDLNAAPTELLKTFRCNCKGSCDNNKCTCKKNSIKCSSACGECHGINCFNKYHIDFDEDEDYIHELH